MFNMKYLFERIEEIYDPVESIMIQLDFVFNSFKKNTDKFNGFGVNIWSLDPKDIKKLIEIEEPRIIIDSITINDQSLLITFNYENHTYEKRLLWI